jgi:drug/metabolite transporter (DMT)-like permease
MVRIHSFSQWQIGFALSLFTALLFGLLPVALKGLLGGMDAYTITWYRFCFATLFLLVAISLQQGMPSFAKLRGAGLGTLLLASLCLCGNYLLYLLALNHLPTSSAQVLIQLAPMLLLVGSLVVYGERFSRLQWSGFGVVVVGLLLFFHNRLGDLLGQMNSYTLGVLLMLLAAVIWAIYGLAQKRLLSSLSSQTIVLCIYGTGALLFWPMADPVQIRQLTEVQWAMLIFSVAVTCVSYIAFAEAMKRWQASRVSAVLALAPILTICFIALGALLLPTVVEAEALSALSLGGALLVVAGSMVSALGQG